MNFPDYDNFVRLQAYFQEWPNCSAAVMVGAGFSLNANPLPGTQSRFPTWNQLARAMFEEICPKPTNATEEEAMAWEQALDQSNPLAVASKYEAMRGRKKLDSFLHKAIPDKESEPGDLHKLLLQLPWRDVFTTNYDTLLERANELERSYGIVQFKEDLQSARIPRIVKLHGTLHSETRLIISREDYCNYPQCFEPYVQTVRQSLTENAMVLVGFSGTDPNFLSWTEWIKAHFQIKHHPIFLVGPLSLTTEKRELLANRGVTPIDLSPMVVGETPVEGIHSVALEWLFNKLLELKPIRPGKWPDSRRRATVTTEPSVSVGEETEPETVESLVGSQNTYDEATTIRAMARWRFERKQYPGWLVPPDEVRSSLWRKTFPYVKNFIKAIQNLSLVDQILCYREIHWRIETSMLPLDIGMADAFNSAVDGLFPLIRSSPSQQPSSQVTVLLNESAMQVPESWLEIAFAVLRDAREAHDSERWKLLDDEISEIIHLCPQYHDRHIYEQALWLLWNLRRDQARNLIEKWEPSRDSPLAMMRKAGLLIELDNWEESRPLLHAALQKIKTPPYFTQSQYIDRLSLEGWCTYLLMPIESLARLYSGVQDPPEQEENISPDELRERFLERWDELRALGCDPWMHTEHFDQALTEQPPAPPKKQEIVPGFDIGHYSIRRFMSDVPNTNRLPAFSLLRMLEQAAIPPNFVGDTLKNAAEWLAPFANHWSPMLIIRAGNTRALRESKCMSPTQISSMESKLARKLYKWAISVLNREPFLSSPPILVQSNQERLLESLIEFLSRLAFKLEPPELQEAFHVALAFHNRAEIKDHISLNKSCDSWFKRMFVAADHQQLIAWLPYLIRFPLPKETSENQPSRHPIISWPDPMTHYDIDRAREEREIESRLKDEIHEAIEWLLRNAQSASGEARQRALMRLYWVFHTNLMTEEQGKHFGDLLWENITGNDLPVLPKLTLFNYLHLPSPPDINAMSKLKQYLLTLKPTESVELKPNSFSISLPGEREDNMIREVSNASNPVVRLPSEPQGKIKWDPTEVRQLWKDVFEWWENDKYVIKKTNQDPSFAAGFDDYARSTLERISMFLSRVVLPKMEAADEEEWMKIFSFLSETHKDNVFLTPALPYILLHRPDKYEMVVKIIRDDLSSDDENAVSAAARAVSHWAFLANEKNVECVPSNIIDDLIRRVVFRRPKGINTCLRNLAIIIKNMPDLFDRDQIYLSVSSLTPWLQSTHIPIPENDVGGFPEHERHLLRVLLGQLASALDGWLREIQPDQPEPIEISTLRELCNSDPLPEVRRSFGNGQASSFHL